LGEGLQAAIAGDGGLGASLGARGEVQVFELRLVEGGFYASLEVVGELALLEDGGEDSLAATDEVAEIGKLLLDVADLDLVEVAGGLFAIAGDEGHSPTLVEQADDGCEGMKREVKGLGDMLRISRERIFASVMIAVCIVAAKGLEKRVRLKT
jgi:hypothetical protein